MRRGDEQVLDVVVLLQLHAHHADAAATLLAVGGDRQALDVVRPGDRDDHVLFCDQILELELALGCDDLGAPVVGAAVHLLDLKQLLTDDAVDPRLVAEDPAELVDPLPQIAVLVLDLLAREAGQRPQTQVEDRLGLDLGKAELLDASPSRAASASAELRISAITASRCV